MYKTNTSIFAKKEKGGKKTMRVEYNGVVYDTETAVCVGEYGEGFYYWPNHNIWMGLYINKDGGLFLYGTGGPLLKAIAIDSDNEHAIYLLNHEELDDWASSYLYSYSFLEIRHPQFPFWDEQHIE